MRADESHPEGCHDPAAALSIGALIRAAADGELTDEQVARFERLCAERDCTQDRVRFEQTLRACCARAMGQPQCTEALRARVRALALQTRDAHPGPALAESPDAPDGPGDEPAGADHRAAPAGGFPTTRPLAFWRRAPALTAAALVLAGAAGVLTWQAVSLPSERAPFAMSTQQAAYRDNLAGFLTDEHARTCAADEGETKLVHRDLQTARAHYAQSFGVTEAGFNLPAPADPLRFFGGGDCQPPGADRSAHLRYDATAPDGSPLRISLFVMPDNNLLPFRDGVTYRLDADACDRAGVTLYAWRADGLVHLLVSEATGELCGQVRQALNAPERTDRF